VTYSFSPSRRDLLVGSTAIAAASMAAPALPQDAATAAPAPNLSGKGVLITGTSSGFGRLAALAAARAGARVFATMRNLAGGARPEARELAEISRTERLNVELLELDITNDAQVVAAIAAAERANSGALHAVVNNAGIGLSGPMELHDQQALAQIFDVNTMGAFRVARAALPAMRAARRGLVINVSSQLGRIVSPSVGAYCGSKFALEAMSEALAYELAPHGVEVTIVQPGGYPTNIWRSGAIGSNAMIERASAEGRAAYAEFIQQSSRRFSGGGGSTDPNDVARAIVELMALPDGRRPLRRPVHPNTRGTDAINACSAQVQAAALGSGPYAPWHAAVTD
jgi:NAD(P)-dependent dehydrogenase (short-subunit alcohol dehydrogenase family)